jgi:hypothetical protein
MLMPQMYMPHPASVQASPLQPGRSESKSPSSSSSTDDSMLARKKRERLTKKRLSTSFKFVGGPVGAISRSLKVLMLEKVVQAMDSSLTCHLELKNIDQLYWLFFRMRPDTPLVDLGLVGAKIAKVVDKLSKARARVLKGRPDGMLGLEDDLSNLSSVIANSGWDDQWWEKKGRAAAKSHRGRTATPRTSSPPQPPPQRRHL